jgi:hypothetical protein
VIRHVCSCSKLLFLYTSAAAGPSSQQRVSLQDFSGTDSNNESTDESINESTSKSNEKTPTNKKTTNKRTSIKKTPVNQRTFTNGIAKANKGKQKENKKQESRPVAQAHTGRKRLQTKTTGGSATTVSINQTPCKRGLSTTADKNKRGRVSRVCMFFYLFPLNLFRLLCTI